MDENYGNISLLFLVEVVDSLALVFYCLLIFALNYVQISYIRLLTRLEKFDSNLEIIIYLPSGIDLALALHFTSILFIRLRVNIFCTKSFWRRCRGTRIDWFLSLVRIFFYQFPVQARILINFINLIRFQQIKILIVDLLKLLLFQLIKILKENHQKQVL